MVGFTRAIESWDCRFFKLITRKHPSVEIWAWALEWNHNRRLIGFFGEREPAQAIYDSLPKLKARTVYQAPNEFLAYGTEVPPERGRRYPLLGQRWRIADARQWGRRRKKRHLWGGAPLTRGVCPNAPDPACLFRIRRQRLLGFEIQVALDRQPELATKRGKLGEADVADLGVTKPRSQRPNAMSGSSGSISVRSQVAPASHVNSLTTGTCRFRVMCL